MSENKEPVAGQKTGPSLELQKTVPLRFPIQVDGATVGSITIRRSKVVDHRIAAQRANGQGGAAYELELFSILTNIPVEAFDNMDYADYEDVQEAYRSFLSSVAIAK
ncbi:hypothetical protein H10PHJ05_54 [Aeromonas phage HJ05]|nr:hypothetical protein H10PHJ05_54 [Aeromonas phage HJ05]